MKKYLPVIAFTSAFILTFAVGYNLLNPKSGPTDKELYDAINRYRVESQELKTKELQGKWLRALSERNSELHDAIIAVMLISKDVNTEIYLHRNLDNNRRFKYTISDKRGEAENILSYNHKNNYFSFDHYSSEDGPSIQSVEDAEFIKNKIDKYYEELGVK